jgi:hypothetical protein
VGTPPLVGREQPLLRLRRALDESVAGISRLALVSGEPGVGKTRLALEILGEAERYGVLSAVGVCWDGAGAPGMWPWVQVLRALRADLGDWGWERAGGLGHAALTRLVGTERPAGPADFHLFESLLQVFVEITSERPVALLLDDVQWADPGSLALLKFLHHHAAHQPLLLIATYRADEVARQDHPRRTAIADLAEEAVTVPLAGLDNRGVCQLREYLGVPTTTAEAEHVRRLTGGNPFFVIESVALTNPTESLGLRRALDRRVDALDHFERQVLTVAALIGREVPDALVEAVVGASAEDALAVVEAAGLMRGEPGQHVFVHDLVRETIRKRVSLDDQRALYAAIVRAADELGVAASLLPAQLAWWATQAVPHVPAWRAVALLEAAADDASARLTHEAAGRHFQEAAVLTGDPDERARLTLASGHAYQRAGALTAARAVYASLLTSASVETRARALVGLHRVGDPAASELRSDVARLLDAIDADLSGSAAVALRAEVLAARSQSRAHVLVDDRSAAEPMAAEALELARSAGDDATIASCLLAYHDAIWAPGTEDARRGLAGELTATGRRLADPETEGKGLLLRMVAEIESGDPVYLVTHQQFNSLAVASRSPRLQFVAASRRGMVATLRADLPAAVAEIDAARALGERIGEPDAVGMWCDQRWQVAHHAGDMDIILELIATLRGFGDPHWMIYEAVVGAVKGDVDRARRLAPQIEDLGRRWPGWAARLWDVLNVQIAVAEGDRSRIDDLVQRLENDAVHWAVLGGGVFVEGPMSVWLGRLEAARGDWYRARWWSAQAEAAAQRLDAPLWALEARADRLVAAHALRLAGPDEIASTVAAARERGLVPVVERLGALLPTTEAPRNVFRRDGDVWTLVFDGLEARIPDVKGLRDLRTLLANPRVEIPATALAAESFVGGAATPVLDTQAKQSYRRRLDELDERLDRAGMRGERLQVEKLERERRALLDELRRAAGLGGRDRFINDERERIRKTVTARIRDSLRRLDDRHPTLAAHLRASVHTGTHCSYAPAEVVSWDLG